MPFQEWTRYVIVPAMACGLLLAVGCSHEGSDTSPVASAEHDHSEGEDGHNLHGYWCVEHGMPEEICAQCNTKLAAEYQAQGDWCDEHSRPDSQCFICHPELEAKFAAQYEAKFGEQPPKPSAASGDDAHEGHDHDS